MQGGKTAVKVSWHRSDGSGEAEAEARALSAEAKKIFFGGEIVYCFFNPAPVFGWCFWVFFGVLKHLFPSVKSFKGTFLSLES